MECRWDAPFEVESVVVESGAVEDHSQLVGIEATSDDGSVTAGDGAGHA